MKSFLHKLKFYHSNDTNKYSCIYIYYIWNLLYCFELLKRIEEVDLFAIFLLGYWIRTNGSACFFFPLALHFWYSSWSYRSNNLPEMKVAPQSIFVMHNFCSINTVVLLTNLHTRWSGIFVRFHSICFGGRQVKLPNEVKLRVVLFWVS